MQGKPLPKRATIERALRLLDIAKNLERIADLSTNIGEDVIFMVEGRVIKHRKEGDDSSDEEKVQTSPGASHPARGGTKEGFPRLVSMETQ